MKILKISLIIIISNLIHYNIIRYLTIDFLYYYISLIFFFLSFNLITGKEELEQINTAHLKNFLLHNQVLYLQSAVSQLKDEKKENFNKIKSYLLNKLQSFQKKLGICQYPFCIQKSNKNFCEDHYKFWSESCCICYECNKETQLPLKCGHFIHNNCMKDLTSCPLCRREDLDFFEKI